MRAKLLSLMLMLLQTYTYAAIIERFSIKQEKDGNVILVENGAKVGHELRENTLPPNVIKVLYKNKTYFVKKADINNKRILELREKIGGIIASHILNDIFKNEGKRYPLLSLAFNPDSIIRKVEPFYILSEELKGFTSIAYIAQTQPHEKTHIEVEDLENLYIGMYLIGSGDPHMRNIFYNLQNHYLGSVDLDVSFKEHIKHRIQLQHNEGTFPDFFKRYSDLAIRTIDCGNFLLIFCLRLTLN